VHDLTAGGVALRVLTGQGAAIDTTTAAGKLVFGIFAAPAEFERETNVGALRDELGITRQTQCRHVAPNGTLQTDEKKILASAQSL